MFELNLIEFLNKLKKTNDESEKTQIKEKIKNLILEEKNEYIKFKQNPIFNEFENFFNTIENEIENENKSQKKEIENEDKNNDVEIIKKSFLKWEKEFIENNNSVNKECENIIEKIIEFYIPDKIEILETIIEISQGENYEKFKNHLLNKLRVYYVNEIENYMKTENYEKLNFFQKKLKERKILKTIEKIARFKINHDEIMEVLR